MQNRIDQFSNHNQQEVQEDAEDLLGYSRGSLDGVYKEFLGSKTGFDIVDLIDQEMKVNGVRKSYASMQTGTSDLLGQMVLDYLGIHVTKIDADEGVGTALGYKRIQEMYNKAFGANIGVDGLKGEEFWAAAQALIQVSMGMNPHGIVESKDDPLQKEAANKVEKIAGRSGIERPTYDIVPGVDRNAFCHGIHTIESSVSNYQAKNSTSGALGRYQFVPKYFWDPVDILDKDGRVIKTTEGSIPSITGATSKQNFLDRPDLQEKFMDYHIQHNLLKGMNSLKNEFPDSGFSDKELLTLVHFLGRGGWSKKDQQYVGAEGFIRNQALAPHEQRNNVDGYTYLEKVENGMQQYSSIV